MKRNMTIRKGILLLLALFGLILAGSTWFSVRYVRNTFVDEEYHDVLDGLTILGRQIDGNLERGSSNPFHFVETAATVQAVQENFSYLVRDSTGMVVAPAFAAGKPLPIRHERPLTKDGKACMAEVWGYDCFVVYYSIPNRPLELVAVYDNQYVFEDIYQTLRVFVFHMLVIYVLLVLLTWFWIIPLLERKERVEGELNSARDLQQKAVTRVFPTDPRFDIHAELRAMKEVGGDIYLCGMIGERKLGFVVGDVSDKGTTAAFVMFMLSSYIRSRMQKGVPLDVLTGAVNDLICDNPDYEMFCTLFLGVIDLDTLEMEYCNAGHTRTLLNGGFLDQDPQLIAGIVPGYVFHTQKRLLQHGDRLLLYTDGVTEARDEARAFFGEARLQAWRQGRPADASCRADCQDLLATLAAFRGKARQNDDIAIMSIKIR